MVKRTALYLRTTFEPVRKSQMSVLQQVATDRNLYVVKVYQDDVSNPRARRRALDQ